MSEVPNDRFSWKVVTALMVAVSFITLSNSIILLTLSLNQLKNQPKLSTSVVATQDSSSLYNAAPSVSTKGASGMLANASSSVSTPKVNAFFEDLDGTLQTMSNQIKVDADALNKIVQASQPSQDVGFEQKQEDKLAVIDALIAQVDERLAHLDLTCTQKQGVCLYAAPNDTYMRDFYTNVKYQLQEIRKAYDGVNVDTNTCSVEKQDIEAANTYQEGVKQSYCSEEEAESALSLIDENVQKEVDRLRPELLGQYLSIQVNTGLSYVKKINDFTAWINLGVSELESRLNFEKMLQTIAEEKLKANKAILEYQEDIEKLESEKKALEQKRDILSSKGGDTRYVNTKIIQKQEAIDSTTEQMNAEWTKIQAFYDEVVSAIQSHQDVYTNQVKKNLDLATSKLAEVMSGLEPYNLSFTDGHVVYPSADTTYIQGLLRAFNSGLPKVPEALKEALDGIYAVYDEDAATSDYTSTLESIAVILQNNATLWSSSLIWVDEIIAFYAVTTTIQGAFDQVIFPALDAARAAIDVINTQLQNFVDNFLAFIDQLTAAVNTLTSNLEPWVDASSQVLLAILKVNLAILTNLSEYR
ncbi:hypothetical protein HYV57_04310 [Candidatus Peregrinibacteria bacterium]|nr:hypothetical protein [Candidatus Peregrinibacteria bacterium]